MYIFYNRLENPFETSRIFRSELVRGIKYTLVFPLRNSRNEHEKGVMPGIGWMSLKQGGDGENGSRISSEVIGGMFGVLDYRSVHVRREKGRSEK